MATRNEYRTDLTNKLLALEDGSYGDFEYSTAELDTFLDLSVARMFPAVYTRSSVEGLSPVGYGSARLGYVSDANIVYDRVFLVEDSDELEPLTGWQVRADRIVGLPADRLDTVNVHWTTAYVLPSDDITLTGIPTIFEPLINLGALIEALEARQDIGVRGEPGIAARTGPFFEVGLLDFLRPRYEQLKNDLAMSLPGMVF